METKDLKCLLWAAIPVASLAVASLSSATVRTIDAVLWAPSFPNHAQVFDCNHVAAGKRYQFNSMVTALDACGNDLSFRVPDGTSAGTTQATQFDNSSIRPVGCGNAAQHRSHLFEDAFTGATHLVIDLGTGPNSGCWNSDVNTGACMSFTPATSLFSSTAQSGGSCANHVIQAVSAGSTP